MSMRHAFPLPLLAACSGDDTTTTDLADCNSIVATPLGTVDVADWPPGVAEALTLYGTLAGRWEVSNDCDTDGIVVKIEHPPQEELEIVTEPWPNLPGLACGCTVDTTFPPDPALDLVVLHHDFDVYLENFPDPGIDRVTVPTSGAFYTPGSPLEFRSCASFNIDPLEGSVFTSAAFVLRVPAGGDMQMEIRATDEAGDFATCNLTDFDLVAAAR